MLLKRINKEVHDFHKMSPKSPFEMLLETPSLKRSQKYADIEMVDPCLKLRSM